MELQKLSVKTRDGAGKKAARDQRLAGNVPAILYGGGKDPVSVSLDLREFEHLVHGRAGEHAIVQLEVQDNPDFSSPALLRAVQHHPVRGSILHADFLRIRLDQKITTQVSIVLKGQPKGVVEGGVLDHQLREVEVECLALEVPDELTLDVTELGMGDSLHVSDLAAPENVTIVTEADRAVAAVHMPRIVAEAEEAEEEEGVEGEEGAEEEGEGAEEGKEEEQE